MPDTAETAIHPANTESSRGAPAGTAPAAFARNCWYVAALGEEIEHALLKRTIAAEDLVMYRTVAGKVVALLDRCPHRLAPLSKGTLVGDSVQCNYHGITFDCEGRCVRVPGEENIPDHFRATSFATIEKWGFVWVWLGDQSQAREALLPQAFRWQAEPGWCPLKDYIHLNAHYQLVIDNLLDLSHEAFLHKNTIGNAAVADTPAKARIKGDVVEVIRNMQNCPPPKLFVRAAGFTTNIDRYQGILFIPPCFVIIEVRAVATGTDDREHGLAWWVLNALTPETNRSTHYFWGLPRSFKQDDAELTELLRAGVTQTFAEDRDMLEGQQRILDRVPLETRTVYTASDQAPTRARSIVAAILAREAAESGH
ncbi:MAG: aromatic ring-hydroxylating dioxygenase subunit alpha [Betaproteobacteria bacterium]|nr:aromatic ring-hydroxylating dioxygenase subunit alpha [Betaproteobacteria bacterium]